MQAAWLELIEDKKTTDVGRAGQGGLCQGRKEEAARCGAHACDPDTAFQGTWSR